MTLRQISTHLISVLRRQKQNGLAYIASTYIIKIKQGMVTQAHLGDGERKVVAGLRPAWATK